MLIKLTMVYYSTDIPQLQRQHENEADHTQVVVAGLSTGRENGQEFEVLHITNSLNCSLHIQH